MDFIRDIQSVLDNEMLQENLPKICCGSQGLLWYGARQCDLERSTQREPFGRLLTDLDTQLSTLPQAGSDPSILPRWNAIYLVLHHLLGLPGARDDALARAASVLAQSCRGPRQQLPDRPDKRLPESDTLLAPVTGTICP